MARDVEIDGRRCLPSVWSRFSSELTSKTRGRKLFREVILNNYVSCSFMVPLTHGDLIGEIARQPNKIIPIESLPNNINRLISSRGRVVFGFPGDYFDQIARNYVGMWWWLSERGLNMRTLASARGDSPFDELAGRLMYEARPRRVNGRLPHSEYSKIAVILDRAGFKLRDYLEREFRKKLANWNQKHPNLAVHKFCEALDAPSKRPALSFLRRGIQKRLNRAESRWGKHSKLSAL